MHITIITMKSVIRIKFVQHVSNATLHRASNWTILHSGKSVSKPSHPATGTVEMNSPLRPLLVQNTMSTLLASNLISALERYAGVAFAA
jgi:hypothetical protein